jgi:hypothetical protein
VKISKKDLEERRARVADGTADDDDRRLVELYAGQDEPAGGPAPVGEQGLELVAIGEAEVIPAKKAAHGRARNGDTDK